MTSRPVGEDEFGELLRSFKRSAFRFEMFSRYALGYERADFERFLNGSPVPPPELEWWRPWLEQISRLAAEGKAVSRVRVLDEPPSDYQRWEMWGARWNAEAGEHVAYISRSAAMRLMLPLWLAEDWWLLDDERVIHMWFTEDGRIEDKMITDEPDVVARFIQWRDLAVQNAIPAEDYAAA